MDELTIENQKYLSSKRAAKITGYAKDYVGQLCREGRVLARLVGRNWYVLESSVLEHRFGVEKSTTTTQVTTDTQNPVEIEWNPPIYTAEPSQGLPIFSEKTVIEHQSLVESENPQKTTLSDMQSAWQEWFDTQKNKDKSLPDSSEMLLPSGSKEDSEEVISPVILKKIQEEPESVVSHAYFNKTTEPEQIAVDRPRPFSTRGEQDVRLFKKQEYQTVIESVNVSRAQFRASEGMQRRGQGTYQEDRKLSNTRPAKTTKGNLIANVALLSITGLFVVATFLAIRSTQESEQGSGNPFYNYINGVSTVTTGN